MKMKTGAIIYRKHSAGIPTKVKSAGFEEQ